MVLGKLDSYMQKNEIRKIPNTVHKDKPKMDYRQKCKTRAIKFLEENIDRTLHDINQTKILYDPPPTVTEIKTKVNKWDLIKLKRFCTAKETIHKVKRQPSEWEKIIANETTDKGLTFKIYKQLIWFLEECLLAWKKTNLIMAYELCDVLLNFVCLFAKILLRIFASMFKSDIGL